MTYPLISVKGLSCDRDDRVLFDNLSCDFFAGDLVQIMGPNGAGKSTFLRCISGLFTDYHGEIKWRHEQGQLKYFGHKISVKTNLTTVENLKLYASFSANTDKTPEQALEEVGLGGFEDVMCSDLSEGQKRRVALASVLLSNASICLLDEPFASLDKDGVAFLEAFLVSLSSKGKLVIFTSHHSFLAASPIAIDLSVQGARIG